MIDTDRKAFNALISNVYTFYRKDFSTFVGGIWWEAMKAFDLKAITDALNRHCINPDNGQFLPMPADVVKMLEGSTQDSALVAWAKVDRGIRVVGTHRSVAFDDPIIHRVITEMGGWVLVGTKDDKEWPFVKNEFVNRYRGHRGLRTSMDYPPVLIGISEAANSRANRQHLEPPTLIGDTVDAQKVMRIGTNRQMIGITTMDKADAAQTLQLVDARDIKEASHAE
jgi:hypothetical protein